MEKTEILEKLEQLLGEQRKDLNNGSDYQDALKILDLLEKCNFNKENK